MLAKLRHLSFQLALTALAAGLIPSAVTAVAQGVAPHANHNLYPQNADAARDIRSAVQRASREHKHILLDFGGSWCGDCIVLDMIYQQPQNASLLTENFIVVHVNIGHMDQNVNIAEHYNVPIRRGVPALAVLDSHGRLLYAEKEKEFEHTSPEAVQAFLERWKP